MQELSIKETELISGGYWGHVAVGIAIAEAAYEFYQGYAAHRR
ncbi:hypothetical protein [Alteromonas sp. ASW11-130]|nr:hypothetical protein [Alteromonas sp. ASW11-130]MCW8092955.1 hypothetical protein [Alteromonas sp. ASW11-130]